MTQSKSDNRKNFPFAARMMDELREFFPEAKLVYAEEKGRTIGTKPEVEEYQA